MGLKRYLTLRNWYSDSIDFLLVRYPHEIMKQNLKAGHEVKKVTWENIMDSQCFEPAYYVDVYTRFLEHGDYGVFGYIEGKCASRSWGRVHPTDIAISGINLELEAESIFIQYVETALEHRRKGLGRECLGELIAHFCMKKIYVLIDINNAASLRLHKECFDFEEIAVVQTWRRVMKIKSNIHWLGKRAGK